MKKEYEQPQAEIYTIKANIILAGSLKVSGGSTPEQNAKRNSNDFDDEYEIDMIINGITEE